MLPVPVIIGIVTVVLIAVVAGLLATKRSSDSRSSSDTRKHPPAEDSPFTHRFDAVELADRLQIPLEYLQELLPQYRVAEITKPRGGVRRLEIPDADTMKLQRTILRKLLDGLASHPLACGFEPHASIVDAAIPHQGRRVVVKMDIRKFFESTTTERIQRYFEEIGWQPEAADILVKLTTHSGHLPQGAPTSPRLSNLVNAPLDEALLQLAQKHGGSYSRYADDMTMSFDFKRGRPVRGIIQVVKRILRSYGYSMHGGWKLKILRQHQQQTVLGLVVNSEVALPRKKRRWLRAVRHRIDSGQPATISEEQLRGWEAFATMIKKQRAE